VNGSKVTGSAQPGQVERQGSHHTLSYCSLTDMSIEIKPHAIRLEDAIDVERTAQARSALNLFHHITTRLTVDRLKGIEYYRAGGMAPYEESYPLGDVKDGRFVSVSLWPMREGNLVLPSAYSILRC